MAKYAISQEGVSQMRILAKNILMNANSIVESSQALSQVTTALGDKLGIYSNQINEIIVKNQCILRNNRDEIVELAAKVKKQADSINQLIEMGLDEGGVSEPVKKQDSSFSRGEGKGADFSTVRSPFNNSFFVPGDCYEHYIQLQQSFSDRFTTESFVANGNDYISSVAPSLIEGINLSEKEANDRYFFWNRGNKHEIESEEYFLSIASGIPEVKRLIESGSTKEDILSNSDHRIADCYNLYFAAPVQVTDCGGYYEFGGGGRHRVLAARRLGYNIPVRVVGRYIPK